MWPVPNALPPETEPPVATVQEGRWAPQPVWTSHRKEKRVVSAGVQTHSLASKPTFLYNYKSCQAFSIIRRKTTERTASMTPLTYVLLLRTWLQRNSSSMTSLHPSKPKWRSSEFTEPLTAPPLIPENISVTNDERRTETQRGYYSEQAWGWTTGVPIQAEATNLHNVKTRSGVHTASYSVGTRGSYSEGKAVEHDITHVYLVPILTLSWVPSWRV